MELTTGIYAATDILIIWEGLPHLGGSLQENTSKCLVGRVGVEKTIVVS